jgi:hypothetical protein
MSILLYKKIIMREVSYGTHQENESNSLLESVSSHAESVGASNGEKSQRYLSALLCLIFLFLCYVVMLSQNILDEVRSRKVEARPWPEMVTDNLLSETHFSLIEATKKSEDLPVVVLIVYVPDDEGQLMMASKVAEGAKSVDNTVVISEPVSIASFQQVLEADAIILGSSVENANTHPLIQAWINDWDIRRDLSGKVGGAFVTAGGISAGEESTLHSLTRAMLIFRMIVVGGNTWTSAFGASAVVGEPPFTAIKGKRDNLDFPEVCYEDPDEVIHPMFLAKAYGLGVRVATVTNQLRPSTCH